MIKICLICNKEFKTNCADKYCSGECKVLAKRNSQKKYRDRFLKRISIEDIQKIDNEEFKILKENNNYYISNKGKIISIRGDIIKPCINISGYYTIKLCSNSKHKSYLLHRLLGSNFIENPDNLLLIDHIDRNRLNNNLDNLRWVNYLDNARNSKSVINRKDSYIVLRKDIVNNKEYCSYRVYYKLNDNEFGRRKTKTFKNREDAELFLLTNP